MLSEIHKLKSPRMKTQGSIPAMSVKTKHFIRKICFQQAASVDMTKYGFVRDSKMQPINLMLKPLREQLNKIIGGHTNNKPSLPQSIIKQPSKIRDEKRSVNFQDELIAKLCRQRKNKKTNMKTNIKRAKTNKSARKITFV